MDQAPRFTALTQSKQNKLYFIKWHGILLMAKKKDGITELVRTLAFLAPKVDRKTYDKVVSLTFALLNGVQFGYADLATGFIKDANDIYEVHCNDFKKKKNNILPFKIIKGGKDDK
jgi:hypothetical protein|tara:strand:- start:215 stop:562 length:348 start_codon:yes stop_codon:yes gene_type:complete